MNSLHNWDWVFTLFIRGQGNMIYSILRLLVSRDKFTKLHTTLSAALKGQSTELSSYGCHGILEAGLDQDKAKLYDPMHTLFHHDAGLPVDKNTAYIDILSIYTSLDDACNNSSKLGNIIELAKTRQSLEFQTTLGLHMESKDGKKGIRLCRTVSTFALGDATGCQHNFSIPTSQETIYLPINLQDPKAFLNLSNQVYLTPPIERYFPTLTPAFDAQKANETNQAMPPAPLASKVPPPRPKTPSPRKPPALL